MKKALAVFALLLPALSTCEYVLAQQAIPPTFFGIHINDPRIADGGEETSYPPGYNGPPLLYGEFRNWDVYQVDWPDIETCAAGGPNPGDSCFIKNGQSTFLPLQYELEQLNPFVNNVMFTLSRTPAWAVTANQALFSHCNYFDPNNLNSLYNGACFAPIYPLDSNNNVQLAPNGTGQDLTWRNWVGALATYVNNKGNPSCGTSCAHVKYWEIWNEFDRNTPDPNNDPDPSGNHPKEVSWYTSTAPTYGCPSQNPTLAPCPTVDQLIRMTEDARCVIKGTGTVDNYPTAGVSTSCADLEKPPYNWPGPIDPTAEIVQPSITSPAATNALKCYLYCNSTACGNWNQTHACQNSPNYWPSLPGDVDIINFHYYNTSGVPENLNTSTLQGALHGGQNGEQSKPLWVGEGSWGNSLKTPGSGWTDYYAQGGFIPRWFASIWSQTLPYGSNPCSWSSQVCQQAFWYAYDSITTTITVNGYSPSSTGALYCPGEMEHGYCGPGPEQGYPPSLITPTEDMWNVGVGWLKNATPATPLAPPANPLCNLAPSSSTVWQCEFTVSGLTYFMVWDNKYAPDAEGQTEYCVNTYGNPYVCGSTPYTVPEGYEYWEDLSGTVHLSSEANPLPFVVGLNPVLLCPNSQCIPQN